MMVKLLIGLTLLGGMSLIASAGELMAELILGRDGKLMQEIVLGQDNTCEVSQLKGLYKYKITRKKLKASTCKYIMAAREIEARIGSCDYKVKTTSSNERKNTIHVLSSSKFSQLTIVENRQDIPTGSTVDDPWGSIQNSEVKQGCLCAKVISIRKQYGLGKYNLAHLLFDGPWRKFESKAYTLSSDECADLFESESSKEIVKDVYFDFGLK